MSSAPNQPFVEHPDRVSPREIDVLALTAVFTFLATITVFLRFITRKYSNVKLWWDDWMILVAWIAAIAFLVLGVVDRTVGGAGYHIETYTREQLTIFFKVRIASVPKASCENFVPVDREANSARASSYPYA